MINDVEKGRKDPTISKSLEFSNFQRELIAE